jgi:dTDP-4-amino-4,6-dideoxygalactose transaminase
VTTPTRKQYLVFGAPLINQAEIDGVVDSMRSGWLGTGPKVAQFEELFREYIGCDYSVALNSCTAALHLSLLVAGLQPGDEVITTSMTFCATVNAILHTGATPVLVDCVRSTQLIDPQCIADAITPRTWAIVPVHLYRRPCDMDAIMDIAARHNLLVIEDAAHAIETVYRGRKVGTIGHLTCFSFYVTKNVVTGEGGMVTTNNPDYAKLIKVLGLHGMSHDAWRRFSDSGYKQYSVTFPGFKYNMMDIQAAIGIPQLGRIDENLRRRNEIWHRYLEAFAGAVDDEIRTEAARALAKISDKHNSEVIDTFEMSNEIQRAGIAWALGKTGFVDFDHLLAKRVDDNARRWIAYVFGSHNPDSCIEEMEKLQGEDAQLYFAVTVLWQIAQSWINGMQEYG